MAANLNSKVTLYTVAAILSVNVFVFLPFTLLLGNIDQLRTPAWNIFQLCILPAIVLFLVLTAVGKITSPKLTRQYVAVIAALSILIWFQGNFMSWGYGLLNGISIDWDQDKWRGWLEIFIWLTVIVSTILFSSATKARIVPIAIGVFFIQLFSTIVVAYDQREVFYTKDLHNNYDTLQEVYRFSTNKNILHIVLDGFQADIFEDLMAHPEVGEAYRRELDGFVFYNETLGVFPYTRFSVPAFLGGVVYENHVRKDDFVDSVMSGKTILNYAADNNYEVDLGVEKGYMFERFVNSKHKNIYGVGSKNPFDLKLEESALILDMALFRSVPHFIKPFIYNEQKWLISTFVSREKGLQFRYFKHTEFLYDLIENISADREEQVYKYIHVMNVHNPMVVDEKCNYAGQVIKTTRKTLADQSRCTMDTIVKLFSRMKNLGIYDDALIIMHADHGGWAPNKRAGIPIVFPQGYTGPEWVASLASPLLAIKKPGSSGGLVSSPLLVSLLDLPDTISDIAGWDVDFGHKSISSMDDGLERERKFYYYDWQENAWEAEYTGNILEFSIKGSHYENLWRPVRIYGPPE